MMRRLLEQIWYISLMVSGFLLIGWGIVQVWLLPTTGAVDFRAFVSAFASGIMGGIIVFVTWFGHNFSPLK